MKRSRWEVRLAGEGGQGIVLAGLILAEAAVRQGKNAVLTLSQGAQQRGGPSQADVVIGSGEIDYPAVLAADVVAVFSQPAFDRFHHEVGRDSWLVVDSSQIKRGIVEEAKVIRVPFAEISQEVTGASISANMVALGLVAGLTKVVSRRALFSAIRKHSPKEDLAANQIALERGIKIGQSIAGGEERAGG